MIGQILAWNWTKILDPGTLIFVVGGIIAIIAIIAPQWRRVRQIETDGRLKQKMIDRGYTADEIERVISAGAENDEDETST